jgi:hypothetical protein
MESKRSPLLTACGHGGQANELELAYIAVGNAPVPNGPIWLLHLVRGAVHHKLLRGGLIRCVVLAQLQQLGLLDLGHLLPHKRADNVLVV